MLYKNNVIVIPALILHVRGWMRHKIDYICANTNKSFGSPGAYIRPLQDYECGLLPGPGRQVWAG